MPKAKELLTVTDTISSGHFTTFSLYIPKIPINYYIQFFKLQTNSEQIHKWLKRRWAEERSLSYCLGTRHGNIKMKYLMVNFIDLWHEQPDRPCHSQVCTNCCGPAPALWLGKSLKLAALVHYKFTISHYQSPLTLVSPYFWPLAHNNYFLYCSKS